MYIMGQMYVQPEVIAFPYFSDNILLVKLERTISAQLPGQQAPRVLLSPSLNARLQGPGFYVVLRIQTQVLVLLLQALYPPSHLPSPTKLYREE